MVSHTLPQEKTRNELLSELKAARTRFEDLPGDAETRFTLARLLFQAGDFWQAAKIMRPLAENALSTPEAGRLAANLAYLLGDYSRAEEILLALIFRQADDPSARIQSETKLLFTYYQTRQFSKANHLFQALDEPVELPMWEQMKSFGDVPPYQIDWNGKQQVSIPFVITDPLPILQVEIQGKPIYALIDTGGDNLYLDTEYAAELGIEAIAAATGKFGGGMEGKIGFARGRRLTLGEVTLDPVPITIMPTQRWSKGFAGGRYTIGGVIGTGILKQFLATVDYPAGRLVLRPRGAAGKAAWWGEYPNAIAAEIPFALNHTHHMFARGSLNEFTDLTFFIDSGLASSAAFIAPVQTLDYTGIPIPRVKVDEAGIGGGGDGLWATGQFAIRKLSLGPLSKQDVEGDYGAMVPETYWRNGFIQDGLLSHQFLRDYRWTLDFDDMKYYFVTPG